MNAHLSIILPAIITHSTLLVFALGMGLLVWIHDNKSITNKVFFGLTAAIFFENVANFFAFYFGMVTQDFDRSIVAVKLVMVSASFMTIFTVMFAAVFPRRDIVFTLNMKQKLFFFTVGVAYIILGYLAWAGFDLSKSISVGSMPVTLPHLPILPIWGIVTIVASVGSCVYLIVKYQRSEGEERTRYLSAIIGLSIGFVLIPVMLFVPVALTGDSSANFYGPLAYVPIFFGVGYGIARHHIFNVKLLYAEVCVLAMIFILFINIFLP